VHQIPENGLQPRVVHELPDRIRIRNPGFYDSAFDPVYMEAVLRNIPGVTQVRFNLRTASVAVRYDAGDRTRNAILRCIEALPTEAYRPLKGSESALDPVGTGAKSVLALLTPAVPKPLQSLLAWGLSLPVLLKGMEMLLTRGVKVEVLDAAAVGFSLYRRDFFTANSITALLAVGEYLEQLSEDKAADLLKNLLRPQVETVWVEREERETQIGPDDLVIGDHVICGAGEMIPVDGVVMEGEALVNQSSITGESVPVHLKPEEEARSGSVIEEGRLKIEARQVGGETGMARISRFLENSLRFKSRSQTQSSELADRLVPATFALGLALFLLTRDVRRAAAVLTVDYACAIKLSNPVAVRTAMYRAAHEGVLLKGAQAMDALARVDTVVFDKTGTLTRGILEVTDVIPLAGMMPEGLLALTAAAEEHYVHPVARAVVKEAHARGLETPSAGQVDFIVAHGVSAFVNGERVLVGSHHFIGEDEGIDCSAVDRRAQALRRQGKSLLYVAREGILEGVVGLRDTLRSEAGRVLEDLKGLGIPHLVMLTGDHSDTARAAAKEVDTLDEVHWDLRPEDKAELVKSFQEKGRRVAYIGDGVNDAPSLVTAEVGICMPGGADLAREAAQVVLLRDDLNALVTARRIAGRTQETLKNCFWASIGLNTLFLLLASSGGLAPVAAAVLHNVNTLGILSYAALSGLSESDDL
jgi:Cu2+-exporting ATPase